MFQQKRNNAQIVMVLPAGRFCAKIRPTEGLPPIVPSPNLLDVWILYKPEAFDSPNSFSR